MIAVERGEQDQLQYIFNTVVEHAKAQKGRAFDEVGKCLYRQNDRKCFAGVLIPDEIYVSNFEHMTVDFINLKGGFYKSLSNREISLVKSLQDTHDFYNPDSWHERFEEIARSYALIYKGRSSDYTDSNSNQLRDSE